MFKPTIFVLALVSAALAQHTEPQPQAPQAAVTTPKLTDSVLDMAYVVQKNAMQTYDDAMPVLNNIKIDLSKKYENVRRNPDVQRLAKTVTPDNIKKSIFAAKETVEDIANRVVTSPHTKEAYAMSKPFLELGKKKTSSWFNDLSKKASLLQNQMKTGYESRYGPGRQQQQQQQTDAEEEKEEQQKD